MSLARIKTGADVLGIVWPDANGKDHKRSIRSRHTGPERNEEPAGDATNQNRINVAFCSWKPRVSLAEDLSHSLIHAHAE